MSERRLNPSGVSDPGYNLGLTSLPSRRQLEKAAKILGGLHAHDEALQLLALLLADDVSAERSERRRFDSVG